MLKNVRFGFFFCVAFTCSSFAATIVVIQGNQTAFGRKYFSGFSSLVRERILAFQYEGPKEKLLINKIREIRPDLVVTIGQVPVERLVGYLPSTPMIVGDYTSTLLEQKANVVLMENQLPAEVAFDLGLQLLMGKKKLGTLYDPKYSQSVFQSFSTYASQKGVDVSAIKVDGPTEVPGVMAAFDGKIEAFLMIKDATTSSDEATSAIFHYMNQKNIPVISLDPNTETLGALLTVSVDPIDLGEQAWNVAKIILVDKKIPLMPTKTFVAELTVSLSFQAAEKAGLSKEHIYDFLKKSAAQGYKITAIP